MKFGVTLGFGVNDGAAFPDYAIPAGRLVEELGFESVWIGEHTVFPLNYTSRCPYTPDGRWPLPLDIACPEPLTTLGVIAAVTERVRLGTAVVILPQRNPVLLAKEVATLDVLSRGRLTLGVGIGWLREEMEAMGLPWEDRAARTDEYIAIMRTLWREPVASVHGRFASFDEIACYPKPAQPGGVPIMYGGSSPAAARRAGRLCDGFFPVVSGPEQLAEWRAVMHQSAREAGRDPGEIEVTVGAYSLAPEALSTGEEVFGSAAVDTVRRLEDAGADRLLLQRVGDSDLDTLRRSLEGFAANVMARVG